MLDAILKEIGLRKDYLRTKEVRTIYFGGGTPSLLSEGEIDQIINEIHRHFSIDPKAEITLEANPDDLDKLTIKGLKDSAVNRLSIGVQSYFDEDLRWMNRAHLASQSEIAIKSAQDTGLENITVDLIYGYPLLTDDKWRSNIQRTVDLNIPHISCYSMTVEPETALDAFIKKGKQVPLDDAKSAAQFMMLMEKLDENGYEHYEISNFAKAGMYSQHNTNYWRGTAYLGIGPSAHSFDFKSRQWNVANNQKYVTALEQNNIPAEVEILTQKDKLNEYIMTSLRTMWGLDVQYIRENFSGAAAEAVKNEASPFLSKKWLSTADDTYRLTLDGKLYADHIASQLFVEDEF